MSDKQYLQELKAVYQTQLLNNIEVTIDTKEVDDIFDKLEELASNLREAYRDNIGDLNQLENWIDSVQKRLMCVSYILPYYNCDVDTFGEHTKPGDVCQVRTNQYTEEATEENSPTASLIPYYLQNHRAHQESHLVILGHECKLKIGLRGRQVPSVRYASNRVMKVLGLFTQHDKIVVYNEFYNRTTVTLGNLLSYGNIVSLKYYVKQMIAFMPKYEVDQDTQVRALYLNADGAIVLSNISMFSGGEYAVIMSKELDSPDDTSDSDVYSPVPADLTRVRVTPINITQEVTPLDISNMRYSSNKASKPLGYLGAKVLYSAYRADNVLKTLEACGNKVCCHRSSRTDGRVAILSTDFELVVYSHDTTHMLGIFHDDDYFYPLYIRSGCEVHLSQTAYRDHKDKDPKVYVAKLIR